MCIAWYLLACQQKRDTAAAAAPHFPLLPGTLPCPALPCPPSSPGLCTTVMGAAPNFTKPTCDHCGEAALHLRACSACKSVRYCSKVCQVAAWKTGGHKAECATLAAARASRQARVVAA